MTEKLEKRNNYTAFIPHKLEVEGRPELSDFSLNILFANVFNAKGIDVIASSLYRPDLETYQRDSEKKSLTYRNIYNKKDIVRITKFEERWEGQKFIKEKRALLAQGRTWKQFFAQLTLTGLSKGERCKYERLEDLLKKVDDN